MKCSKCKVTLAPYLDKCPLCGTKVQKQNDNNVYNDKLENFSTRINILYFSRLIMKILFLSNIICIVLNLIINKQINWSLYVLASTIHVFSYYLYLILENKRKALIINVLTLELLLFTISFLTKTTPWFLYLVGPFILLVLFFILLNFYLSKYKNILRNFSCILIYIAFSLNIIDICVNFYKTKKLLQTWSIPASSPILIISIIFIFLSFNKKITEEVEKRFFI